MCPVTEPAVWYVNCSGTHHEQGVFLNARQVMSSNRPSPVPLSELVTNGLAFRTSEAVALTAEVCRQAFTRDFTRRPDFDEILINPDGSIILPASSPGPAGQLMSQLASLLEAVLPPLGSPEPDFAVRASLRMLAPRARQLPGLPPILGPESLAAELDRFATGPTSDVLRDLWIRGDRALHRYLPEPHTSDTRRIAVDDDDAFAVAADRLRDGDTPVAHVQDVASRPTRQRFASLLLALGASIACASGFGAGVWAGRHTYATISHIRPAIGAPSRNRPAGHAIRVPPNREAPRAATESAMPSPAVAGVTTPAVVQVPGLTGPAFSPSFTEDGREILFHVGRDPVAQIAVARLEPGGRTDRLVVLSDDRSRTYHARRSPDGQLVAFDSDRDGERAVYVARRDGSQVTKVSGAGHAALPSWSPNMKWLALVRAEPARPRVWNLWLRDVRSGAMTRLTQHQVGQTWNASWFPDSRLVCYSHEDRLFVLDIATRRAREFQSPRRGRLVRTPAVSPDGTRIIFQVSGDGVWLLDLTNGTMRRILDDKSAEEFAWDPQGKHVAYHSHRDGRWRLWMMAAPSA
jgi:hypothetical protein